MIGLVTISASLNSVILSELLSIQPPSGCATGGKGSGRLPGGSIGLDE